MSAPPKLSKKQQKAAQFKSAGPSGTSSSKESHAAQKARIRAREDKLVDVPEDELMGDGLDVDGEDDQKKNLKGKGKEVKIESKKRKRGEDDDGDVKVKSESEAKTQDNKKKKGDRTNRFILFVGNLPFTVTHEEIALHFKEKTGKKPTVRLLTSKPDPNNPKDKKGKPRGVAFIEFTSSPPLQSALLLHHTEFLGRIINVELTAGGGGTSDVRKQRIAERNETMRKQAGMTAPEILPTTTEEEKKKDVNKGKYGDGGKVQKWESEEGGAGGNGVVHPSRMGAVPGTKGDGQRKRGPKRDKWQPEGANAVRIG